MQVIIYIEVFKTDVIVFIPPLPKGGRGYTVLPLRLFVRPSKIFFLAFFAGSFVGKNLIFGHKRHIGIPYCGQCFWTRQIPTSCLPTQLVFMHIEHTCICTFFVTFFSATIDGRNLIFGGMTIELFPSKNISLGLLCIQDVCRFLNKLCFIF